MSAGAERPGIPSCPHFFADCEYLGMPLVRSKDSSGPYYRWVGPGKSGTKFYYVSANAASRNWAKSKAQGRAEWRGGAEKKAKRPKPINSAARAKQKMADRGHTRAIAAYRRDSSAVKASRPRR